VTGCGPDPLTAPHARPVPLPAPRRWVALAGDWHGDDRWAQWILTELHARGVRVVVQLGDFGVWPVDDDGRPFLDAVQACLSRLDMLLLFLDGNHDDLDQLEAWERDGDGVARLREQIWHLPRALRWTWQGVRFAALGGATSLDARHRRPHRSWWPQEALRPHQVDRLTSGGVLDVLLTHDAPALAAVPGLSSSGWDPGALEVARWHRRQLQDAADATRPRLLVHGHMHVRYQAQLPAPYAIAGPTRETLVAGLDCDSSSLDDNVVLLDLTLLRAAVADSADVAGALRRPSELPRRQSGS
jgi:predicted phosphodiesterase